MKIQKNFLFVRILLGTLLCLATPAMGQIMVMNDADTKYATALLQPGTIAPDFKLKSPEGKSVRLSEHRGHYVVLDFWASWCPDCRKDAPNIVRMYNKFHACGVDFIGVSFDTDVASWRSAITKYDMRYEHVSELKKMRDATIAQQYGVKWIPSMTLIDPQGKVVLSTVLSDKLEKTLTELTATHKPLKGSTEQVSIAGSKGRLAAIIQRPELQAAQKCPMVVLMHGFTSNKEVRLLKLIADSLQANGVASVRFDFNGHGASEGDFRQMTVPNEIEDACKVVDYVASLPYVDGIGLAGHSQGGVVAAMAAGQLKERIKSVVLLAPAAVLRDDAIRGNTMGSTYDPLDPPDDVELFDHHRLGRNYIETAFRLPIYETAALYKGKACVIHGTGDRVVPYTYGLRFHQQWAGSRYIELEGFDHGFSQNIYRAANEAAQFLIHTLK